MMTSSNGSIFCVTGPLCLICAWTNGWANKRDAGDLRRLRAHNDAKVMQMNYLSHCGLVKYVKLLAVHVPGMPGMFSPPPRVSDPGMHRGTCVTHLSWCMPGSLTSGFLWSRWRGKRPGILGACANRNFTYLARGPLPKPTLTYCHLDQTSVEFEPKCKNFYSWKFIW